MAKALSVGFDCQRLFKVPPGMGKSFIMALVGLTGKHENHFQTICFITASTDLR